LPFRPNFIPQKQHNKSIFYAKTYVIDLYINIIFSKGRCQNFRQSTGGLPPRAVAQIGGIGQPAAGELDAPSTG